MISEWNSAYTYQLGDGAWHDNILHYCYKRFSLNDEPGYECKHWTTDKNAVLLAILTTM